MMRLPPLSSIAQSSLPNRTEFAIVWDCDGIIEVLDRTLKSHKKSFHGRAKTLEVEALD